MRYTAMCMCRPGVKFFYILPSGYAVMQGTQKGPLFCQLGSLSIYRGLIEIDVNCRVLQWIEGCSCTRRACDCDVGRGLCDEHLFVELGKPSLQCASSPGTFS